MLTRLLERLKDTGYCGGIGTELMMMSKKKNDERFCFDACYFLQGNSF